MTDDKLAAIRERLNAHLLAGDCEFTHHAPQDVDYLLAEIERLAEALRYSPTRAAERELTEEAQRLGLYGDGE